jgi:hypothetical protein
VISAGDQRRGSGRKQVANGGGDFLGQIKISNTDKTVDAPRIKSGHALEHTGGSARLTGLGLNHNASSVTWQIIPRGDICVFSVHRLRSSVFNTSLAMLGTDDYDQVLTTS